MHVLDGWDPGPTLPEVASGAQGAWGSSHPSVAPGTAPSPTPEAAHRWAGVQGDQRPREGPQVPSYLIRGPAAWEEIPIIVAVQ